MTILWPSASDNLDMLGPHNENVSCVSFCHQSLARRNEKRTPGPSLLSIFPCPWQKLDYGIIWETIVPANDRAEVRYVWLQKSGTCRKQRPKTPRKPPDSNSEVLCVAGGKPWLSSGRCWVHRPWWLVSKDSYGIAGTSYSIWHIQRHTRRKERPPFLSGARGGKRLRSVSR